MRVRRAGSDPVRGHAVRHAARGCAMPENQLIYGDNLDVLPRYVTDESVDLIYLDPPFNSNADYNVLFAEQDRLRAAAQIKASGIPGVGTRSPPGPTTSSSTTGPNRASQAMQAFRKLLGENDMLAYLAMMAPRLVELRRVLKPTGSIYLHCDPTASHYLKLLLDAVFGPENFRNEIIWKRTTAHSDASEQRMAASPRCLTVLYEGTARLSAGIVAVHAAPVDTLSHRSQDAQRMTSCRINAGQGRGRVDRAAVAGIRSRRRWASRRICDAGGIGSG